MTKQIKLENKDSIIAALDALKPKAKVLYTPSEIAKMYRAKISLALKNGYSFKEIAEIFKSHECSISAKELELSFVKLRAKKQPEENNELLANHEQKNTTINTTTLKQE